MTNTNRHCRNIHVALFTALLASAAMIPCARAAETFDRSYGFNIQGELNLALPMRQLLVNINRSVDRYLGTPGEPRRLYTLRIHILPPAAGPATTVDHDEIEPEDDGRSTIMIRPGAPFVQTVVRLTRAVLAQRMALVAGRNDGKSAGTPPEWLVAAVAAPVVSPRKDRASGRLSPEALAPVTARFNAAEPPDLLTIIKSPVPERFENAYSLYSLHAYMIAEIIAELTPESSGAAVRRIIQIQAQGRDEIHALRLAVEPLLPPGIELQEWYEQAAADQIRKRMITVTGADVAKEISFLLTVDADDVPEDDLTELTRRVPLTAIPNDSQFWVKSRPLLIRRLDQFIKLLIRTPRSFREPVTEYTNAFQALLIEKRSVAEFKRRINRTDQRFAEVFHRHRRISDHLAAYELKTGTNIPGIDLILAVINVHRHRIENLHPNVSRYLDQLESEMR